MGRRERCIGSSLRQAAQPSAPTVHFRPIADVSGFANNACDEKGPSPTRPVLHGLRRVGILTREFWSSSAIVYAAWGAAPLATLLAIAAFSEGSLRKRLILLVYALAAVGVGLLIHAWWIGNAIVLVGLPLVLFPIVGGALVAASFARMRAKSAR